MTVGSDSIRPEKVTLAVKLLATVIGVGIVQVAMLVYRHIDVRSPEFIISMKLAIYAFSIFLLFRIAAGRNWARLLLVAIFVIAIPLAVLPTFQSFAQYPIYSALEVAQVVLYLVTLAMLFHRTSSPWFAKKRETKQRDHNEGPG